MSEYWTKNRVVTTLAELDGLPHNSIVSTGDLTWQKRWEHWWAIDFPVQHGPNTYMLRMEVAHGMQVTLLRQGEAGCVKAFPHGWVT